MCSGDPTLLRLCDRCAKNLEMLDLAGAIEEVKDKEIDVGGFSCVLSEAVPENSLFIVPSRAALENALEHDEVPDLRRYFGSITNIG